MGDAHFFPHPEDGAQVAVHESPTGSHQDVDGGEAGFCFHPEHEVGLSLHEALTTLDELELRHLEAPLTRA